MTLLLVLMALSVIPACVVASAVLLGHRVVLQQTA
jgi:hypothetical protein